MNEIITEILKREGWDKYTDRPNDRGGPTKWGITQKAWSDYLGHPASKADIQSLSETAARVFYLKMYIHGPKFDLIDDEELRALVIDCGVNHGPRRATKWLQLAARVKADGVIGQKTLFAVNTIDPMRLFLKVIAYRIKLYGKLVTKDPTQAEFAWGWNNRAASFLTAAADALP